MKRARVGGEDIDRGYISNLAFNNLTIYLGVQATLRANSCLVESRSTLKESNGFYTTARRPTTKSSSISNLTERALCSRTQSLPISNFLAKGRVAHSLVEVLTLARKTVLVRLQPFFHISISNSILFLYNPAIHTYPPVPLSRTRSTLAYITSPVKRARSWLSAHLPKMTDHDLLPIGFEIVTGAIVLGNDSTPSVLIASFESAKGTYGIAPVRFFLMASF
jgi:hypothetical protein